MGGSERHVNRDLTISRVMELIQKHTLSRRQVDTN